MKDTQLLEFFNNLKSEGKISNVLIRMRSSKDIDIVCVVDIEKIGITKIMIESCLYTQRGLNICKIIRRRDKILALTNEYVTYEISVVGKDDLN